MDTFAVPTGCDGVTVAGKTYRSGGTSRITVDNPRHAALIRSNGTRYIDRPLTGFRVEGGRTCACGFAAWDWQSTCPRCGRELKES